MNYYKFAQKNCSNYSASAHGKSNYCWLSGQICTLHPSIDLGCFYFCNNVLPLDKKLEAKWLAEYTSDILKTTKKASSKPPG